MKPVVLILILAFTVWGQSIKEGKQITDWVDVYEGQLPGNKSYPSKASWSPSSIRRGGDIIKVWLKVEFPQGADIQGSIDGTVSHGIAEVREFMVMDCAKRSAIGDTEIVYFQNGRVQAKDKLGSKNSAAEPTDKESFGYFVASYFCERDIVRQSNGPPVLKKRTQP